MIYQMSSVFGYIPKSDSVAHLTVQKSIVEKLDAPGLKTISGTMLLAKNCGGHLLMYYMSSSVADVAQITLPAAQPGLSFEVVVDKKLSAQEVADGTDPTVADTSKLGLTCAGTDTLSGWVLKEDTGSDSITAVVPTHVSAELVFSNSNAMSVYVACCAEFSCVVAGVWRVKLFGPWSTAAPSS